MSEYLIRLLKNKYYFFILIYGFIDVPCFSQDSRYIDSIIQIANKPNIDSVKINAYNNWGIFVYKSNTDSALLIYEKGVKIAEDYLASKKEWDKNEKRAIEVSLAHLLDEIGFYYSKTGKITFSIKYYFASLKLFEKHLYFKGIANELNNIGFIYFTHLNDYQKAKTNFEKAAKIFHALKDTLNEANTLHNLGSIYQQLKDYDKAISYFLKSIDLRLKSGDIKATPISYNYLSLIYSDNEDYDIAIKYLFQSLEISREFNDKSYYSNALSLLGRVYFDKGVIDTALIYGLEAHKTANELNFPFFIRSSSKLLSDIYKEKEQWENAYLMNELYQRLEDSTQSNYVKNEILRQEIIYEFDKKAFEDSIRFEKARLEKDFIIKTQSDKIKNDRNIRNFILLAILLAGTSALLLLNRRRLRIKAKENRMKLDTLSIEQKLLRVQMNPHFIFNALNSIQSFIIEKETKLADEYLIKFSQLLRSIIEQTQKSYITAKEEIETLMLYIEMEQLRFSNKFSYEFRLSEEINLQELMLPPLIFQPFVENAIVHGISNKTGNGKIIITMQLDQEFIKCSIEDDGIGRANAAKMKLKSKKRSSSIATQLVKDRLEKIKNQKSGSVNIIDLYDDKGNPSGTRVDIAIPKQKNRK
jgi:tetratricopeptide (TPR) repeat protein